MINYIDIVGRPTSDGEGAPTYKSTYHYTQSWLVCVFAVVF